MTRYPTFKMMAAYITVQQNGYNVKDLEGLRVAEETGVLYFLSKEVYEKFHKEVTRKPELIKPEPVAKFFNPIITLFDWAWVLVTCSCLSLFS